MNLHFIAIPLKEIGLHFKINPREDIKIIAPRVMTAKLAKILSVTGKNVKQEKPFDGVWKHSAPDRPNLLCPSSHFNLRLQARVQTFTLSFANQASEQQAHYHKRHIEIYFSEHLIGADFQPLRDRRVKSIDLEGGALIFGLNVVHKVRLGGLTIVIEFPAVKNGKFLSDL